MIMQDDRQLTIRLYETMIQQSTRRAMQHSIYANACNGIRLLYDAGGIQKPCE